MPTSSTAASLPVLDFRQFDAGGVIRQRFLEQLRGAAREFGFFYLVGHGIAPEQTQSVLSASRRFFQLPEQEKLKIEMVNSAQFRGYTRVGWERTRGQPDWREQLDIGAERPAVPHDPARPTWQRLVGPNQWPEAYPDLRQVLLGWQETVTALAVRLIRSFAASLGQAEDVFQPIYAENPNQRIKVIRYPGREATESDQGVGAHKDGGFVTVLLQERQSGLQVEGPNGWIDAPPLAGSFVINVGELLELASNGYLRATVHRVVAPPAGTDRLSVAMFLGARLDSVVPVLDLPADLAAQAGGVTQDPHNPLFHDVGKNYLKGRLRSHPDVARRHYADLLSAEELAAPLQASSAY